MVFTLDDIKNEVKKIKNETEGTYGLKQFGTNKEMARKAILAELKEFGHYGFDPKYKTFEEYLLDSVNGEEAKKDTGDGAKLKEEFGVRADSYYNAFAMVITCFFYMSMVSTEKEKKANWQKNLNKMWENFENVRSYNGSGSAKAIYGTKTDGGDTGSKVRYYEEETKDNWKKKEFNKTWNEALIEMKAWGETGKPVFNLDQAKTDLLKEVDDRIDNTKYISGSDKTDFENTFFKAGEDYGHWKVKDGIKKWLDDKAGDEDEFLNVKDTVLTVLADTIIKYYIEKAKLTADKTSKESFLKKIEDYGDDFADSVSAFNDKPNKEAIEKLQNELITIIPPTGDGRHFATSMGGGTYWGGQGAFKNMAKDKSPTESNQDLYRNKEGENK